MRKLFFFTISLLSGMMSYSQSKAFNDVFEACKLAQSSMSFVEGSKTEIKKAKELLTGAEWSPLILQPSDVKNETSIKNHMVFSPEFLTDVINDSVGVYRRAKEYAKELNANQRGGSVKLCTKCIKAGKEVKYAIRHSGGEFNIATVAEVNGLINLTIDVKDAKGNKLKSYKINSDEFKGAPYRKIENIPIPKGNSLIYITIENKFKKDKSVAIIVE